MTVVICHETKKQYLLAEQTPVEALRKVRWVLDHLRPDDEAGTIHRTGSYYYIRHSGRTWAVRI